MMRSLFKFGLLCVVILGQIPCHADAGTAPVGFVLINRANVKLSDLFRHLGPAGDQLVGPAPLPGQQIIVPAAQRAVIAARFHLTLKNPPHNAVVIRRSGQAVPIARLQAALAPTLAAAGAPSRPVVSLINTQSPMIPPDTQPTITTTDLQFNPSNDHFSATLVITAPGMGLEPISVDGSALPGIAVVIATHTLQPGEIITGADIADALVPRASVPARPVRSIASVLGMQVQRAINAHEPLSSRALASPLLVRKGALVELVLHMPGITISAHGIALASGSAGDVIEILNPNSQAVLQAVIRGPDRADVVPGSVATHQQHPTPYYRAAEVQ
jgi:flagella basal body P-ring formation protein FlgA